ncbi:hypothetical protein FC83_GL001951 [Agrilactobacillus composti DSM 18527 = JCM 14202]|uniref:ATP-grasp domain-containing protein n=1 Tax=Agrilactobacillus composti DSM 18527 = JCM 14202 TaxID=1423734 RepID=X0PCW5_9LACO|nr:ATP-grasp domain-containing protein [Agrilactobacillus composti]KRM34814.1 hypothetical protein FC83_GL001951 [Agrilactobacillus composti DSM 18527 = JCM 14202]GAF38669.1 biotin carboxylase-like [Agrilactobacillus composti DSM 18527 = JCM 14202]
MKIVLLGKSFVIARKILEISPSIKLIVIDNSEYLKDDSNNTKNMSKFISYVTGADLVAEVAPKLIVDKDIVGVIPAFERTVTDANLLAKKLNLSRIGDIGAEIFRDKYKLREFCEKIGINQPPYKLIHNVEELRNYFSGKPLIYKPISLAGSVGVVKISEESTIDSEYSFTEAEMKRENSSELLGIAEEYVPGSEFSCEYVVESGNVVFRNITKKFKFDNGYFVESGHLVPGIVNGIAQHEIFESLDKIVSEAQIGTAILHSEWIVTHDNQPVLVEIAGRRPGDRIVDLISLAYGFDFLWEYCLTMIGENTSYQGISLKFAEQKYFEISSGEVISINGIENFANIKFELDVHEGDIIPEVKSSEDRRGYFILSNNDFFALEANVRKANKLLTISTKS